MSVVKTTARRLARGVKTDSFTSIDNVEMRTCILKLCNERLNARKLSRTMLADVDF